MLTAPVNSSACAETSGVSRQADGAGEIVPRQNVGVSNDPAVEAIFVSTASAAVTAALFWAFVAGWMSWDCQLGMRPALGDAASACTPVGTVVPDVLLGGNGGGVVDRRAPDRDDVRLAAGVEERQRVLVRWRDVDTELVALVVAGVAGGGED